MERNESTQEPRDNFTLQVIAWIQDVVRNTPALDRSRQEVEFQQLLDQPLESFEQ